MIRAAAKNFRDVLVVTSPADYARVLARPRRAGRAVAGAPLRAGAEGVRAHGRLRHGHRERTRGAWPCTTASACASPSATRCRRGCSSRRAKLRTLRYGENPHQPAAWYVPADVAAADLPAVLQGKELSFTNLLDVDAACAHRDGVRRAGGGRHQAHEPVRRGDRAPRSPTPTCGRATPTRSRPSAASSAATARSTRRRRTAIASTFIEAVIAPVDRRRGAGRARGEEEPARGHRAGGCSARGAGRAAGLGGLDLRTALGGVLAQEQDRVVEARERVAAATAGPRS